MTRGSGTGYDIRKADDLMRLPVWARYQIQQLVEENAILRSITPCLGAENSEAVATIGHRVQDKVEIPLGRRVQVDWFDNWNVKYSKDAGGLVVTTHDGPMAVVPQVSNQVVIRTINAGIHHG